MKRNKYYESFHGAKTEPQMGSEGDLQPQGRAHRVYKVVIIQLAKNTEGNFCEIAADNSTTLETHYEKV